MTIRIAIFFQVPTTEIVDNLPDISNLCVVGHPSRIGGADTELHHQIRCWIEMGITVHICPTGPVGEDSIASELQKRGCIYHAQRDWESIEGLHCISFCNGDFLAELPKIRRYARTTTFVNCMSWNFDLEIEYQKRGLIDFHLYQTQHSYEKVSRKLTGHNHYRPLFFSPYFDPSEFLFHTDRSQDKFRFGRISRDDGDKFGANQLWIYEAMTAPAIKEGLILGWGENAERKCGGSIPNFVTVIPPNGLSQRAFYAQCEAIIMTTDTFENLPRVGFEAMASGSILIVDNRGGWKLEVEDGVTGWLCDDHREFVYKASRCAFEKEERDRMRLAAREKLERTWGLQTAMDSWAQVFEELSKLDQSKRSRVQQSLT